MFPFYISAEALIKLDHLLESIIYTYVYIIYYIIEQYKFNSKT